MFQKNVSQTSPNGHEPETVIAASVKVEGDFASQGNVLIEGVVEGSLKTARDLRVGERARIAADVEAQNATVAGEIRGNLTVGERLELEASARVMGDVKTKILVVASGAIINGRVMMGGEVIEERASAAMPAMRPAAAEDRSRGIRAAAEKLRADQEKEPALVGEEKAKNAFFR
jgi:cytoskeletal protein CcmA (bactofilin family)